MDKDWIVVIMDKGIRFRWSVSAETKEQAITKATDMARNSGRDYQEVVAAWEDDWLSKEPFNGCCPE